MRRNPRAIPAGTMGEIRLGSSVHDSHEEPTEKSVKKTKPIVNYVIGWPALASVMTAQETARNRSQIRGAVHRCRKMTR